MFKSILLRVACFENQHSKSKLLVSIKHQSLAQLGIMHVFQPQGRWNKLPIITECQSTEIVERKLNWLDDCFLGMLSKIE